MGNYLVAEKRHADVPPRSAFNLLCQPRHLFGAVVGAVFATSWLLQLARATVQPAGARPLACTEQAPLKTLTLNMQTSKLQPLYIGSNSGCLPVGQIVFSTLPGGPCGPVQLLPSRLDTPKIANCHAPLKANRGVQMPRSALAHSACLRSD